LTMTVLVELSGRVPAGPLTAADMPMIDLDVPFEISDGRLEIMTPPSFWHQYAAREVERVLEKHYAYVTGDVTLAVGDNGRRPDAIALPLTREEILERRIKIARPDMVEVVVEVISHDEDRRSDTIAVARDREVKFREYAEAGIPEYWVVDEIQDDPQDASVEIYHLRDGRYAPMAVVRLSDLVSGKAEIPAR
jgi:Uma2 family endonuclease